jgi:Zn-dependent M16 (insulinase) family peptidase
LALEIISACLFDTPNGPLYKSLIESGKANSFVSGSGYDRYARESSFTLGVANINK